MFREYKLLLLGSENRVCWRKSLDSRISGEWLTDLLPLSFIASHWTCLSDCFSSLRNVNEGKQGYLKGVVFFFFNRINSCSPGLDLGEKFREDVSRSHSALVGANEFSTWSTGLCWKSKSPSWVCLQVESSRNYLKKQLLS